MTNDMKKNFTASEALLDNSATFLKRSAAFLNGSATFLFIWVTIPIALAAFFGVSVTLLFILATIPITLATLFFILVTFPKRSATDFARKTVEIPPMPPLLPFAAGLNNPRGCQR